MRDCDIIKNGELNDDSIVIAHSIGNAYFVRFCKEKEYRPNAYIAVAPGAVYEYPSNRTDYIVEVKKQAYVKEDAFVITLEINGKQLTSEELADKVDKFGVQGVSHIIFIIGGSIGLGKEVLPRY